MAFSSLSGRLSPPNLDENNVVKFENRKYQTYELLNKDLELWRTINFVQLTRRNCPLLKSNDSNADEMQSRVYKELRFECIHYGDPRQYEQTDGSRPNQKLNAIGCKMFLHYKWFNGNFYLHNSNLKVTKLVAKMFCLKRYIFLNFKHLNHPETKEHWETHPSQRRVTQEEREEAERLFRLHVPFRDLKREMKDITGKKFFDFLYSFKIIFKVFFVKAVKH